MSSSEMDYPEVMSRLRKALAAAKYEPFASERLDHIDRGEVIISGVGEVTTDQIFRIYRTRSRIQRDVTHSTASDGCETLLARLAGWKGPTVALVRVTAADASYLASTAPDQGEAISILKLNRASLAKRLAFRDESLERGHSDSGARCDRLELIEEW